MKPIPKLLWCDFPGDEEMWPLTTEGQITAAQEEMRIQGFDQRSVLSVRVKELQQSPLRLVDEVYVVGTLYSDVNGLVIYDG